VLSVWFEDGWGRSYVIGTHPPRSGRRLEREHAREIVRAWAERQSEIELRRLLEELEGYSAGGWERTQELVARIVERTWCLYVYEEPRARGFHRPARAEQLEPKEPEVAIERHDLRFEVQYPDGSPASGWDYRLTEPTQAITDDAIPEDGVIEKLGVPVGTYQLELKEVSSVAWRAREGRSGEPIELVARVSGFDDGAAAKVRIFREHQELDRQVVDTLDATVAGGEVVCAYTFDPAKNERRAAQTGRVRLIAEVALEHGVYWAKTLEPLVVQLKTLTSVRWSARRVRAGLSVEVIVAALGYQDGAAVTLELSVNDPIEGPTKIAVLSATLEAGEACYPILFALSLDREAPIFEADRIQQEGEYFVRAVIDDDVHREGRSGVLFCDARGAREEAA
jgi:hypothetical protein